IWTCDLFHRARSRGHDGAAAGERLGDRQAEALVQRDVSETAGAAVLTRELVVVDLAEPDDVAGNADAAPAARADHAQLTADRRGDSHEVLSRFQRSDREHVLAARARALGREDGVDSVRHDANLRLR